MIESTQGLEKAGWLFRTVYHVFFIGHDGFIGEENTVKVVPQTKKK
jgi:hypothetical protein